MVKNTYNDYELIYLIRSGSEIALNILLKKYDNLIYKKIIDFKVFSYDFEDFFQEGLMILNNAIFEFNEIYNKSFTKFLELLLNRRFSRIRGNSFYKNKFYILNDSLTNNLIGEVFEEFDYSYYAKYNNYDFSNFEKIIFDEYFLKNKKIDAISNEYNIDKKKIYNSISRIKEKIKIKKN